MPPMHSARQARGGLTTDQNCLTDLLTDDMKTTVDDTLYKARMLFLRARA